MGGRGRWAYMSRPDFNPPSDACPQCEAPSKVYYIGGKHVPDPDGGPGHSEHRWQCEHRHEWIVVDHPVWQPDPDEPPGGGTAGG